MVPEPTLTNSKSKTPIIIIASVFIVSAAAVVIVLLLLSKQKHDYSISYNEEKYVLDCNTTDGKYCSPQIIRGKYSNESDVKIYPYFCSTNNGEFECELRQSLSDYYALADLDPATIGDSFDVPFTVSLVKKDNPGEEVISKKVMVTYNFSSDDKALIANAHEEYLAENAQTDETTPSSDSTDTTDTQTTPTTPTTPSTPSTPSGDTNTSDGTTWKTLLAEYENWVDKYVEFRKRYKNASTSEMASMMTEAQTLSQEMVEWSNKVSNMQSTMSTSDLVEYQNSLNRIRSKLEEAN